MACINKDNLIGISRAYISVIVSRSSDKVRYMLHKMLVDALQLDYRRTKEVTSNLERFGYKPELESLDYNPEREYVIRKIAERVVDNLLEMKMEELKHSYSREFLEKWKEGGYWICEGKPVVRD